MFNEGLGVPDHERTSGDQHKIRLYSLSLSGTLSVSGNPKTLA